MRAAKVILLAVALGLGACAGGDDYGQDDQALMHGGGDGPPVWKDDPCDDPNLQTSAGVKVSVQNGVHVFVGTGQHNVIVGTDGPDVIWGGGGGDIICGRGGEDEIHAGAGDDFVNGGAGNDTIFGGAGNDVLHGGAGGDEIHGGDGDDLVFGDLLDDKLWGDDGDDLLVGGHGTDEMHGGKGNDFFRGDTGNDSFEGGEGTDVVSFMTAMPPGEGEPNHPHAGDGIDGVIVNFTDPCVDANDPQQVHHDGCAFGDGKGEPLDSIEIVIGSPYADHFITSNPDTTFIGGAGDDKFDTPNAAKVHDGPGNDTFNGQPIGNPGPTGAPGKVFVYVEDHVRDLGVIVAGTTKGDDLSIHPNQHQLQVDGAGPTQLDAGPGCAMQGPQSVICNIPHTLRFVAAYGDDGDDHIKLTGNFPRDFTAHVNGGRGDDQIRGGDEADVLFTGVEGQDWLWGMGGDDALLSESEPSFNALKLTQQVPYTDGADHLFGGPGNDQLVADFPCGGHEYSGGDGIDIAGFARSGALPITAQLAQVGDNPSVKNPFYGRAYNPEYDWTGAHTPGAFCSVSAGTTFHPDLEILEASSANDDLWGNDQDNVIWGRKGNDRIHGLAGDDVLAGLEGDDAIWGDDGNDVLQGGPGYDTLYAVDGERDVVLCGPGGGLAKVDAKDEVTGCKY